MSMDEETLHKRKVIKWLAIGTGALGLILAAMLIIGGLMDQQETAKTEAAVSENDLANAKVFATEFITKNGTFGLSDDSITNETFDFVKSQTAEKSGAYDNDGFGLSRGERYESLIPAFDPNGEEDITEYFAKSLNAYYPDWSGQLLQYKASDVLLTPGKPYYEEDSILLPMQVSFTSTVNLYSDEKVASASGVWKHYSGENFVTAEIALSQQSNGSWRVWSVEDLDNDPYVLATWSSPDWRTAAPNKATLISVE